IGEYAALQQEPMLGEARCIVSADDGAHVVDAKRKGGKRYWVVKERQRSVCRSEVSVRARDRVALAHHLIQAVQAEAKSGSSCIACEGADHSTYIQESLIRLHGASKRPREVAKVVDIPDRCGDRSTNVVSGERAAVQLIAVK